MWCGAPYVKQKAASPHKKMITENRIKRRGHFAHYAASSNRASDVKVNLKPGVEDPHAVSKTHITVGS